MLNRKIGYDVPSECRNGAFFKNILRIICYVPLYFSDFHQNGNLKCVVIMHIGRNTLEDAATNWDIHDFLFVSTGKFNSPVEFAHYTDNPGEID